MKRGQKVIRRNRVTGQPRRWICYNNLSVDWLLADAETIHHFVWYARIPADVLQRMADDFESRARGMREVLARKQSSPYEEYCRANGVDPVTFRKAA